MSTEIYVYALYGTFTGVIISLFTLIAMRFYLPKLIKNEKNLMKNELEYWLNSETGQKALYMIGGLVSSGMRSGLGLNVKGGKFKLENIIAQLVGSYVEKRIIPSLGNQPEFQPNLPQQPNKSALKSKY